MVICDKILDQIIALFKKDPTYIEIIPIPNVTDQIKFDDITNIWKYYRQSDVCFLNKYGNIENIIDDIF